MKLFRSRPKTNAMSVPTRRFQTAFAPLALVAACSNMDTVDAADANVPAVVKGIIIAPLSASDRVDVQYRGKFAITPTTLICGLPTQVDGGITKLTGLQAGGQAAIDLTEVFKRMGQTDYIGGTTRYRPETAEECVGAQNIHVLSKAELNPAGKPYRLTLAIWQTQAAWVGRLERNGRRPDSDVPFRPPLSGDGPCCEPSHSMSLDYAELEMSFNQFLNEERK